VTIAQYNLKTGNANIIPSQYCFKVVKGEHRQEVSLNDSQQRLFTFISIGSLLQKARTAAEIKFGFSFSRAATPTGTYAFVQCSNSAILPG
jgi:hypothetical protein